MTGNKKWFKSKAVWGGIVALLAAVASLFGYSVGEADQSTLAELLAGIGGAVGGVLAIYGRIKADSKVE